MRIIFTAQEIKAGLGVCNELIDSSNSIAKVIGDAVEDMRVTDITDEDIKNSNKLYSGIFTISKSDDGYIVFDIEEDFVVESCDLCRDFIIDFSDILKYAIKTLKAFAVMSMKPFQDKWQKLISKNVMSSNDSTPTNL